MTKNTTIKTKGNPTNYVIETGSGILKDCGTKIRNIIGAKASKAVIVSNKKVFGLYGTIVENSLKNAGFSVVIHLVGDGERFKNMRSLEGVLKTLGENRITRTDVVIALGGGVVGDITGFAAAIHLRGVTFFQIPTTLLSMIDSSVGGKTGVNSEFGKNLIGAFYQPAGVFADISTLSTLPKREAIAGFMEAVKQGAIGGKSLLDRSANISDDFRTYGCEIFERPDLGFKVTDLVTANVAYKAKVVRTDERESAENTGKLSRKILNFGHTFGHALEKATQYRYLKHGEAVGWGILFAAILSKKLEMLSEHELNLLNDVVHRFGTLPDISHIPAAEILDSIVYDKKVIGGKTQWILLQSIGEPLIVSSEQISRKALLETHKTLLRSSVPHK